MVFKNLTPPKASRSTQTNHQHTSAQLEFKNSNTTPQRPNAPVACMGMIVSRPDFSTAFIPTLRSIGPSSPRQRRSRPGPHDPVFHPLPNPRFKRSHLRGPGQFLCGI